MFRRRRSRSKRARACACCGQSGSSSDEEVFRANAANFTARRVEVKGDFVAGKTSTSRPR